MKYIIYLCNLGYLGLESEIYTISITRNSKLSKTMLMLPNLFLAELNGLVLKTIFILKIININTNLQLNDAPIGFSCMQLTLTSRVLNIHMVGYDMTKLLRRTKK